MSVPMIDMMEIRIKRTIANFTDAKKDQRAFFFDNTINLYENYGINRVPPRDAAACGERHPHANHIIDFENSNTKVALVNVVNVLR